MEESKELRNDSQNNIYHNNEKSEEEKFQGSKNRVNLDRIMDASAYDEGQEIIHSNNSINQQTHMDLMKHRNIVSNKDYVEETKSSGKNNNSEKEEVNFNNNRHGNMFYNPNSPTIDHLSSGTFKMNPAETMRSVSNGQLINVTPMMSKQASLLDNQNEDLNFEDNEEYKSLPKISEIDDLEAIVHNNAADQSVRPPSKQSIDKQILKGDLNSHDPAFRQDTFGQEQRPTSNYSIKVQESEAPNLNMTTKIRSINNPNELNTVKEEVKEPQNSLDNHDLSFTESVQHSVFYSRQESIANIPDPNEDDDIEILSQKSDILYINNNDHMQIKNEPIPKDPVNLQTESEPGTARKLNIQDKSNILKYVTKLMDVKKPNLKSKKK